MRRVILSHLCAEESLVALQKAFPAGKRDGLSYALNDEIESFNYTVYNKVKGIEVGILDACLAVDTLLSLEPITRYFLYKFINSRE